MLWNKLKTQNKLKYNFPRSLYLLQVANVTGISTKWTKWFPSFQRFELWRVSFPTGGGNWFEFAGVSDNRGFEKLEVKLQCWSEAYPRVKDNWFELPGGTRNRGFEKSRFYCISVSNRAFDSLYVNPGLNSDRVLYAVKFSKSPGHAFDCSTSRCYFLLFLISRNTKSHFLDRMPIA